MWVNKELYDFINGYIEFIRPMIAQKYYTAYWGNREALRISMKCYAKFIPSDETDRIVADLVRQLVQHIITQHLGKSYLKGNLKENPKQKIFSKKAVSFNSYVQDCHCMQMSDLRFFLKGF